MNKKASKSKPTVVEALESTNNFQNISENSTNQATLLELSRNHSEAATNLSDKSSAKQAPTNLSKAPLSRDKTATSLQEPPVAKETATFSQELPVHKANCESANKTASSLSEASVSSQNISENSTNTNISDKQTAAILTKLPLPCENSKSSNKNKSPKIKTQEIKSDIKRLLLVILGGILLALNIVVFARTANLFPGGFTGISLLIQNIFQKYFNISLPYSAINYILNAIPIFIGIKYIGKKFTLFSVIMIFVSGIFTDLFANFSFFHVTDDLLLCSVFGGIVNGGAISLCLFAGASSGGTDFISIFISEKTGKSAWNLIFAFNCCVLFTAGLLFGWDKALYSIIFQFTSTQIINTLYKKYEKTTLLIITEKPAEIYAKIKELTNHAATVFEGRGEFSGKTKKMVYTVVSSSESGKLEKALRSVDPEAFINVLQSKEIIGRFFKRAND